MVDIRRLPRANNSFEDIRKKNQIYVDHTYLIMNLLIWMDLIFYQDLAASENPCLYLR